MTTMLTVSPEEQKKSSSELVLRMPDAWSGDELFLQFCRLNPEMRIERNEYKEISIMPPTTSETGNRNAKLTIQLGIWNEKYKLGEVFDSSTGFKLPNGAERSPDLSWIQNERWEAISIENKRKFAPVAPDFVLELRSADQSLIALKEKMEEYIACGCRLGWLIDPQARKTFTYSENGDIQTVSFEDILSGGEVLPGFELVLADLFK
jgi:Uma2 family endonuclease